MAEKQIGERGTENPGYAGRPSDERDQESSQIIQDQEEG